MSKERKNREERAAADAEALERILQKVKALEEAHVEWTEEEVPPPPLKRKSFSWKKFGAITTPIVAAAVVGIVVWVNVMPLVGQDDGRYCDSGDYNIVAVETTIKEYALQEGKPLLYFDWYDSLMVEEYENSQYQLKETGEVVALWESTIDINTGCAINIHITDSNTQLDILESYQEIDQIIDIDGVEVGCKNIFNKSFASFEYEGYIYYLQLDEPNGDEHILDLVRELLP